MTVAAVLMVKDEADIIRTTIDHLLGQVDFVMVADNGSTDGTRELLAELERTRRRTGDDGRRNIYVLDDREPAYFQSEKMSALAGRAHAWGAEWIVPCDADEVWYSPFGRIADVLSAIPPVYQLAAATLFDHVVTSEDDVDEVDPVRRIRWRRPAPGKLPKVAARAHPDLVIEQGNHGAHYRGLRAATVPGGAPLVVRHFPYRSVAQMVTKARNGAAAYAATDLGEDVGAHWRGYGRILDQAGEQGIADHFHQWFYAEVPTESDLVLDPALDAVASACA